VRFYVHQFGPNAGSINLSVVEIKEKENVTTTLWWSSKNRGEDWNRENVILPNITTKYYMQFEARMGMRIYSDVAIDDFSLSPECFGLNIPEDKLDGYNYWDPRLPMNKQTHKDFVKKSFVELTTCGSRGKDGPKSNDCIEAYKEKELQQSIKVLEDAPFRGVQMWKVPSEDYYTVIAKGAGGGLGSGGIGSSRGASAVTVLELHKDEEIYFLVGQKGEHACIKSMGHRDKECGGLGIGRYFDDQDQHGRGIDPNEIDVSGEMIGEINKTGGPGGGWRANEDYVLGLNMGASLLDGSRGGEPCYPPRGIHGQGGFGGGGGGCNTGGGGGGYAGGYTRAQKSNGEGGTSYVWMKRSIPKFTSVVSGDNSGHGMVVIIRALNSPGCGCDYRCLALDEFAANVVCICPEGSRLKKDNQTACENNRYQRKREAVKRHKSLLEQDLQLSRLRHTADESALTNFNPNYGCDGILNGNVDVKSLPQVARESLRLVRALGQGAFGEVYQGLYRHRDGDAVEMPVAVKTLPEMSTGQAEADFLMEAAIMAKFNHPNIVHLIGVCFDRHPRFIVLELLAGGDLKNFLREGRSKPERPSPLTMKDLVFCAVDVAKGCRYMESKRFIHRDIAARNCLLSSKGPGRVVKIADFGMARDIYRSDYYRKGGKAMLPIKWMPPEAFLDGIFTSKTDVWSFGVLLWEVFSLGLMPYTGLPNRDVMQLVTGGGRLDASPGCPPAIYRIMADCWSPLPETRPTFSNLLERLSTCTQDPEVMNAPLPTFFRPPSTERDQTIMRPTNDDFCLRALNSSDYLIPLPGPRIAAERLLTEAACVTLSESVTTCAAPTITSPSVPKLMHDSGCWETSFIMPNSKSDQLLLSPDTSHASSDDKLISLDTPQQTPTTIKPPHSFSDKETTPPITLDPSSLPKQGMSYANVRMVNAGLKQSDDKITANGSVPAEKAPFTIQGFNERYMANENHPEISC
ncbi:ALK tyrosine kinase receptor, partial [Pseudolycoriella hygida]